MSEVVDDVHIGREVTCPVRRQSRRVGGMVVCNCAAVLSLLLPLASGSIAQGEVTKSPIHFRLSVSPRDAISSSGFRILADTSIYEVLIEDRPRLAIAHGGQITAWPNRRLGLVGGFLYARRSLVSTSTKVIEAPEGLVFSRTMAEYWSVSGGVMLKARCWRGGGCLYVFGKTGVIAQGDPFHYGMEGGTVTVAVAGIGVRLPSGSSSRPRVEAADFSHDGLHRFREFPSIHPGSRSEDSVVFAVGLVLGTLGLMLRVIS